MRFSTRYLIVRDVRPEVLADSDSDSDSPTDDGLGWSLMEAISGGSQEAFVLLFDRTADAIAAELAARLPEPGQRLPIFAATYVEAWWLAGCRGTVPDVTHWLKRILDRRIADAHLTAAHGVDGKLPPGRVDGKLPPGRAELELADLLGRPIALLWPT
jgi:hypothetical protein